MTTIDRFDPFERRITDAIHEIAAERRPDYLDAVFEATARSRQRPRWAFPERWIPVNRLLIAAAATILIVAVGGAMLISARGPSVGPAGPTPSPTAPSETPLVSGLGRGMGFRTTAPDFISSATWVADTEIIPALGQISPRLRLTVNQFGSLQVIVNEPMAQLVSTPVTGGPGELALVSPTTTVKTCHAGDFGRYAFTQSTDGVEMRLDLISDACQARATTLARTWTRSIDRASHGGQGAVVDFDPMLFVTLPDGSYTTNNGNGSVNIESDRRSFIAVKNPTGWTDPCSDTGGTKVRLANTIDAFVGYIGKLPGFSIGQQDSLKIDGDEAVHLLVPSAKTPECQKGGATNGRVIEWGTADLQDPGFWFLGQGDTDVIYLVQHGSDVYLLQWLGDGVTPAEELSVLNTVHFFDSLPTAIP